MNLIQIQDRLKELPNSPQVMQLLASYANGANPEVPPYLAMTEMMRRKKLESQHGGIAAPQGTIKDKLEQDAMLAAMQPKPAANTGGANPAMTGIAAAPMQGGATNFAPGGIVAFARGSDKDGVDEGYGDDEDEGDDGEEHLVDSIRKERVPQAAPVSTTGVTTAQKLAELEQRMRARESAEAPTMESPIALQNRLAKENPEMYGMLNVPVGKEYLAGLRALQEKQAAEEDIQRKGIEGSRLSDFFKSLIAAGEATRGQRGIGALLGGYGSSAMALDEQRRQQLAGIRQQALKRDELMNSAMFEVSKLQRAQAEGDVKAEQQHVAKVAEIAAKLGVSVNSLLGKQYTGLAGLRQKELGAQAQVEAANVRARATKEAAKIRADAIANRPEKATDFDKMVKAEINAAVAHGADPKDPAVLLAAFKNAAYTLGKQAGTISAETTREDKINKEVENRLLLGAEAKEYRELKAKNDVAGIAALRARVKRDIEAGFPVPPGAPGYTAPAARASSAPPLPSGFVLAPR